MKMSSDMAVQVNDLHKIYRLGAKEDKSDSAAAALISFLKSPLKNYRKYRSLYDFSDDGQDGVSGDNILRALSGVSFDVKRGEVVGIIGANGAGKSTLLKVLSRITATTKGEVRIRGRISSLLEVGTGFHPELTGRENIYLNGTILGMKKKEIDASFDEIVHFAEVEAFLDTPVKRYSSGMRVRLAFAVAAHLEPEILIVDEVLAVGDAQFQKKCLDKMQSVGESGKTVLFVSHSMPAISRMCTRGILLDSGRIVKDGSVQEVIPMYLDVGGGGAEYKWDDNNKSPGTNAVRLRAIRVLDEGMELCPVVNIEHVVKISMEFEIMEAGHVLAPSFWLENEHGVNLFVALDQDPEWTHKPRPTGVYHSTASIPPNFLSEGLQSVSLAMHEFAPRRLRHFKVEGVAMFQVVDKMQGSSARGQWVGDMPGAVRPMLEWQTVYKP